MLPPVAAISLVAGCAIGWIAKSRVRCSEAVVVAPKADRDAAAAAPPPPPPPAPVGLVLGAHPVGIGTSTSTALRPLFARPDPLTRATRYVLRATLVRQARACYIATRHRLADLIAANGGSMGLTALLNATKIVSADHLYRILRACESAGIFSVEQDGDSVVVHNTPDSELLCRDAPGSLAPLVLHASYESALALNHLDDIITSTDPTKETAWDFYSPNANFWEWLDQEDQRETLETFNTLMVNITMKELPFICGGFDWKAFLARIGGASPTSTCSIVDVGGGKGHLLRALLDVASFRPVVFDTANMIDDAKAFWKADPPADAEVEVEFVIGDFFDGSTIPAANCYVLKHILHDWSDDKSVAILKAIREQANTVVDSRVMLVELVLDETKPLGPFESWVDIQMLNVVGGKERSRRQWERDVLSKAGFKLEAVHVTGGTEAIIECSVRSCGVPPDTVRL